MTFEGIKFAQFDGKELLLSRDGKKTEINLESTICQIIAHSTQISARTISQFESEWHVGKEKIPTPWNARLEMYGQTDQPVCVPIKSEMKFSLSAQMSLGADRIYGFKGNDFLGKAELITLHVVSAPETRAYAGFWEADRNEPVSLHLDVTLEESLFQATFRSLWLSNSNAMIDIILGIPGFQWGPEASFREYDDPRNLVMRAGIWSVELRSLDLVTKSGDQTAPTESIKGR